MPRVYKAVDSREEYCKQMHMEMNMKKGPTKLVSPTMFMLVDTDEIQKQVNRIENRLNHMDRMAARRKWRSGNKKY